MDDSVEIIVKGKGSDISSDFYEPINIPTDEFDAKLGVKNFATFNNIPNIVEGKNNKLKIKVPGQEFKMFSLETGAYELKVIAEQMLEWIGVTYPKLENVEENFKLIGNDATSKAEFVFKDDYGIDFEVDSSMYKLLGFDQKDNFHGTGLHVGKRIVKITNVTQLIFNCNITTSNYINGKEMPFLYSCGIDVPAGYRLTRDAYKNLTTSQINHIRIWIVDEHGAPVNLRDDNLTVTLSLRINRRVTQVSLQ